MAEMLLAFLMRTLGLIFFRGAERLHFLLTAASLSSFKIAPLLNASIP